jgi:MFS family permease
MTGGFAGPENVSAGEAAVLLEPTRRVSRGWTTRFTLVWLGLWMATLVPIQLALPDQLADVDYHHRLRDFGLVNGLVGLFAILTLPLFGALCDHTRSRFGRRRVWVLMGLVVFAVGLVLTGLQSTWEGVALCWLVASLGNNMMAAGLTATIADEVPEEQRGTISGAIYGPQAIGVVLGLVAVGGIAAASSRYAVLALALVLLSLPFLIGYRDVATTEKTERLTLRSITTGMWINPRENPDFGWAFGGRLLVNLGNAFGTANLLFFLRDGMKVPDPDAALLNLTLVYLVFTVAATYLGGFLSDRSGRRRIFVAVAAILQAIAALLLTPIPSMGVALVAGAFLGAGYGAFMSVDQALVTHVLPDPDDRAKDLGIMNIGAVGPQALAPLLAGVIITSLGGYPMLFLIAAVTTLLGAASVYRIRSVR